MLKDKNIATLNEVEYIEIDKELIPYSFTYDYEGNIFEIEIRYNAEFDYFTADLYILKDSEKITLILGEKLMLSQLMFMSITYLNIKLPAFIPYDFSEKSKKIGWDEIKNISLVVIKDDTV